VPRLRATLFFKSSLISSDSGFPDGVCPFEPVALIEASEQDVNPTITWVRRALTV
jgi:hypothetical protein